MKISKRNLKTVLFTALFLSVCLFCYRAAVFADVTVDADQDIVGGPIDLNVLKPTFRTANDCGVIWIYVRRLLPILAIALLIMWFGMLAWNTLKLFHSQGNPEQMALGKKRYLNLFFALVALIGVFVLINIISLFFGTKNIWENVCDGQTEIGGCICKSSLAGGQVVESWFPVVGEELGDPCANSGQCKSGCCSGGICVNPVLLPGASCR